MDINQKMAANMLNSPFQSLEFQDSALKDITQNFQNSFVNSQLNNLVLQDKDFSKSRLNISKNQIYDKSHSLINSQQNSVSKKRNYPNFKAQQLILNNEKVLQQVHEIVSKSKSSNSKSKDFQNSFIQNSIKRRKIDLDQISFQDKNSNIFRNRDEVQINEKNIENLNIQPSTIQPKISLDAQESLNIPAPFRFDFGVKENKNSIQNSKLNTNLFFDKKLFDFSKQIKEDFAQKQKETNMNLNEVGQNNMAHLKLKKISEVSFQNQSNFNENRNEFCLNLYQDQQNSQDLMNFENKVQSSKKMKRSGSQPNKLITPTLNISKLFKRKVKEDFESISSISLKLNLSDQFGPIFEINNKYMAEEKLEFNKDLTSPFNKDFQSFKSISNIKCSAFIDEGNLLSESTKKLINLLKSPVNEMSELVFEDHLNIMDNLSDLHFEFAQNESQSQHSRRELDPNNAFIMSEESFFKFMGESSKKSCSERYSLTFIKD